MKSIITFLLCLTAALGWSLPIQSHHAAVARLRAAGGGGGSPLELISSYSGFSDAGTGSNIGWQITPNTNLTITHVGAIFMSGSYADKTIHIRASGGTSLGSATAPISGATLNVYTWAALGSPLSLTSGTTYLVTSDNNYNGSPQNGTLTHATTHMSTGVVVIATDGTVEGTGAAFPNKTQGLNIRYTVP